MKRSRRRRSPVTATATDLKFLDCSSKPEKLMNGQKVFKFSDIGKPRRKIPMKKMTVDLISTVKMKREESSCRRQKI
jgi:hypothetical protein